MVWEVHMSKVYEGSSIQGDKEWEGRMPRLEESLREEKVEDMKKEHVWEGERFYRWEIRRGDKIEDGSRYDRWYGKREKKVFKGPRHKMRKYMLSYLSR